MTVVLPTGEELVCDPVCEPVNSSDQVKKNSKEYSSQIWESFYYFLKSLDPNLLLGFSATSEILD